MSPPSARIPRPPRIRRPEATIFDAYVAVDWSARSGSTGPVPRRDAVWVAEAWWDADALRWEGERYFPTRRACIEHLVAALAAHLARARTVLVGFDFPLGYPAGLARAVGLDRPSWRALWRLLRDPGATIPGAPENRYAAADNRNDRFAVAAALNRAAADGRRAAAGPFHGCPARHACAWLAQRSPEFPFAASAGATLERWRRAELRLRGSGLAPLSAWWVLGGGPPTVGGQALVGIPAVHEIAERLGGRARVWPFETGFTGAPAGRRGGRVVLAEIWPGLVARALPAGLVRDAAQVRAVVRWAAGSDAAGSLAAMFDRPAGLAPEEVDACTDEEGWILGVR